MGVRESAMETDGRAEQTRRALIRAAVLLFGEKGYDHTTVRDLIGEAGVNLAAINYHFNGKEGLRLATIEWIAEEFQKDGPGKAMAGLSPQDAQALSPDEARSVLRKIMKMSFVQSAAHPDADLRHRYILREIVQGGELTELFFDKVFSPQFAIIRALVSRVTGEDAESRSVRARAINLVAQSAFLNIARPLVLLALGWDDYSPENTDIIADSFWLFHE